MIAKNKTIQSLENKIEKIFQKGKCRGGPPQKKTKQT